MKYSIFSILLLCSAHVASAAAIAGFDVAKSGLLECPVGSFRTTHVDVHNDPVFGNRTIAVCHDSKGGLVRRFYENRETGESIVIQSASLGGQALASYRSYYLSLSLDERKGLHSPDAQGLVLAFAFRNGKIERVDTGVKRSSVSLRFQPDGSEAIRRTETSNQFDGSCRHEKSPGLPEVTRCFSDYAKTVSLQCRDDKGRSIRGAFRVSEESGFIGKHIMVKGTLLIDGREVSSMVTSDEFHPAEASAHFRLGDVTFFKHGTPENKRLVAKHPEWARLHACSDVEGRAMIAEFKSLQAALRALGDQLSENCPD